MDGRRHSVGKAGEDAAAAYLESLGHEIVARGWRNGHLEVDIISETGKYLHFVEVKTRFCPEVTPASAVNRAKMLNMCRAARAYLFSSIFLEDCSFFWYFCSLEPQNS